MNRAVPCAAKVRYYAMLPSVMIKVRDGTYWSGLFIHKGRDLLDVNARRRIKHGH